MSELNAPTLASMDSGPGRGAAHDGNQQIHRLWHTHTNLQELETSPGYPTLQGIFAVNLAHVPLSLITALSYMGKTRVTQPVNSHGWKNAIPAGCFHFESEIKSERTNVAVPTPCTVWGVTGRGFEQLFFLLFATVQKSWL